MSMASKTTLQLDDSSRLMLFAPHPDDETLAAGVLLQTAARARANLRVVYMTDGDNNPWPQRLVDRKWRLDAKDRKRWGRLRRQEALAALDVLGVPASAAYFLGFPDQGLTSLLLGATTKTVAHLCELINEWKPTHLVLPAVCDRHPDHNAIGVLLRLALPRLHESNRLRLWTYLVHGDNERFFRGANPLPQTETCKLDKIRAIHCHRSQVKLSRRRFLGYAARPECFAPLATNGGTSGERCLRLIFRRNSALCLRFDLRVRPRFPGFAETIFIVGHDRRGATQSWRVAMPVRSGIVAIEKWTTGEPVSTARFQTDYTSGWMFLPESLFSDTHTLFVKYHRRSLFFDQEGWLELEPKRSTKKVAVSRRETIARACVL